MTYLPEKEEKSHIKVKCVDGPEFAVKADKFATAAEMKQIIA